MAQRHRTISQSTADVFTAIAHPIRRQILERLVDGEQNVMALAEPFDVSRSAISQHLNILLETNLVTQSKRGRENYYQLRPENLNEVYQWIGYFEQLWSSKLDRLSTYLNKMATGETDLPNDET